MKRWVVKDGDVHLAVIEASPETGVVTIQIQTSDPVAITPDRADDFRAKLGLAAGVARGETGADDG